MVCLFFQFSDFCDTPGQSLPARVIPDIAGFQKCFDQGRRELRADHAGPQAEHVHVIVPDALRSHWQSVIDAYFHRRRSLRGVVLLMDVRHPLTDFDRQMLDWCDACRLPVHVVLTKADKLRRAEALAALSQVRAGLPASATAQLFSARQRAGIEELARRLAPWYGYDSEDSRAPGAAARIGDTAKGEPA